jgi:hypothetical protein
MGVSRHGLAPGQTRRLVAVAALLGTLGLSITAITAPSALGDSRPASQATGPTLKLVTAQKVIEAGLFGKGKKGPVYIDPGIWLASFRSAFQLDVERASYTKPLTVTQEIESVSGTTIGQRRLPASILDGWNGLKKFVYVVIRNKKGKIIERSHFDFCPDSYGPSRTNPGSALNDNYPEECSAGDPFGLGEVWGLPHGWAVEPTSYLEYKLALGTYKLTMGIPRSYRTLFHISAADGTSSVTVKVVKANSCCGPLGCCLTANRPPAHFISEARKPKHGTLPRLPAVKTLKDPPVSSLPDLIPTPAWSIYTEHLKKTGDFLTFGSTVWISGHGPLDVEGFRDNGSDTMTAYQFFWEGNHLIGKAKVGTMGFSGYNSWHFQQFAQYKLLNAKKKVVVRSRKIGFCIAPTDNVNMLLKGAVWQPEYTGIAGNCGDPDALWVQELLPLGWGDTYFQYVPHQSFDISKIPNGTYYIEIIANPEHLLHEVSTANDVSLRKVIIGGKPGHRTVRVPAYDGIDPEK